MSFWLPTLILWTGLFLIACHPLTSARHGDDNHNHHHAILNNILNQKNILDGLESNFVVESLGDQVLNHYSPELNPDQVPFYQNSNIGQAWIVDNNDQRRFTSAPFSPTQSTKSSSAASSKRPETTAAPKAIRTTINPTTIRTTIKSPDSLDASSSSGSDYSQLNATLVELFSKQRSDEFNRTLKDITRQKIIDRFSNYGLKVLTQNFKVRQVIRWREVKLFGSNLIAILPGRHRDTPLESITVIGGHYDTVAECPGIDDNGSGSAAVLEVARAMSTRARTFGPQNSTLIFVLFDLEEWGALGSMAFVNHFLIERELVRSDSTKVTFNGAYILDMVLNFDTDENRQTLPDDVARAVPHARKWIRSNKYRGDFLSIWARKGSEERLVSAIEKSWLDDATYKLLPLEGSMSSNSNAKLEDLLDMETFLRSDHASFWYHRNSKYAETLPAVLLTDMGPWRGVQQVCYHDYCDDARQLDDENLRFLRHTIEVLVNLLINNN